MSGEYEPVIGLEVHCQLATEAKAFSPDSAAFGGEPNSHVDPVSLGHPGTLPVPNKSLVDLTLRIGLATHCSIRPRSVFARKHYFYPDLPKGYQISQYDDPICFDGHLDIEVSADEREVVRRIRIRRIHMEEDAGKSIHERDPRMSLLDYNRCGVPLIEIVTEPDIRSPREAYHFMQTVRQIVRYLGICDGNMEEGSLRCDANVSVRRPGQHSLGTKTEVKNMNSFRHVERALEFEISRQIAALSSGGGIVQETRLWDPDRQETRPMRAKEAAHDYRYFPDPDLVPVVIADERLDAVRSSLPEMPWSRRSRLTDDLGLPDYDAGVLTEERSVADYFDAVLGRLAEEKPAGDLKTAAKMVSNFVMTHVLRLLNERGWSADAFPVEPVRLAGLIRLRLSDSISSTAGQTLFDAMLEDPRPADIIAADLNLLQVSDTDALRPVVAGVVRDHPGQVQAYLGGKDGLFGFFIGQVMRRFEGSADPSIVRELLELELESLRRKAEQQG